MESGDGCHLKVAVELDTLISESYTGLVAALGFQSPSVPNGSLNARMEGNGKNNLQLWVVNMTQCFDGKKEQQQHTT